jgi:prepilin-type N-terminal cleavage/methylation domain-containing protein
MSTTPRSSCASSGASCYNRTTVIPTRKVRLSHSRGFTLIEMAVAVFIIALLLGSILVPLATQVEQRQIADTQKMLDEIREALIGFAVTAGYLPCPDKTTAAGVGTANDGQEDVSGGACVTPEGNLPWVTLGIANSDVWSNRFRYRVDLSFANHTTPFTLTSTSTIAVCTTSACTVRLTTVGDGPPALILSHGKNGYGARSAISGNLNPNPTSADEIANNDANATFVSRPSSAVGATAGEFDDIVVWVPKTVLFNRMVAAGKLP